VPRNGVTKRMVGCFVGWAFRRRDSGKGRFFFAQLADVQLGFMEENISWETEKNLAI